MKLGAEKLTIGFLADILYIKGFICFEEYDAIMNVKEPSDLDAIIERMIRGEYNPYKKGESYIGYSYNPVK